MSHFIADFIGTPNGLVGGSSYANLSEYDKSKARLDSVNRQILQDEIKEGYLSVLKQQEVQHVEMIKSQSFINNAIHSMSSNIDMRMRAVQEQMELVNTGLAKLSEIMMIPDFEKERLHYYSEGLRYLELAFTNVSRYSDALEFFQKAANTNKRDFLVNHEIGKIFLYSSDNLNIEAAIKALALSFEYAYDEAPMIASEVAQHLAFAYYLNGELDKAVKFGDISFVLDDSRLEGLYISSEANLVLGNTEEGIKGLKHLVNKNHSYLALISENVNISGINQVKTLIEELSNINTTDLDGFSGMVNERLKESVLMEKLSFIKKDLNWYNRLVAKEGIEAANEKLDNEYGEEIGYQSVVSKSNSEIAQLNDAKTKRIIEATIVGIGIFVAIIYILS